MSFENDDDDEKMHTGSYFPKIEKMTDVITFFDRSVKITLRDYHTTECLLDYLHFKEHYKTTEGQEHYNVLYLERGQINYIKFFKQH